MRPARSKYDVRRLSSALAAAGIDLRHWVSYGTVGTVDDKGQADYADKRAVYVGPEGVEVDVILEPLNIPVTCTYAGIQGGASTSIYSPIRPGDRVLVTLPDGLPSSSPVIVSIMHSATSQLPLDPADKKPYFRNDRLLVHTRDVDVDVRTAGGSRVQVKQDGTVVLNNGTRGVARIDDTIQLRMSSLDIAALAVEIAKLSLFLPNPIPTPTPPSPVIFTDGKITSASTTVKSG